jgi:hypothetical protein
MNQIGRRFALSAESRGGVFCDENGVFVGPVPLLERIGSGPGAQHEQWQPRPASDLNRELTECYYGLPIEFGHKIGGLMAVARALSRGDIVHAQIATLHLQIPDPPIMAKSAKTPSEIIQFACQLRASGLLKADWDPAKHPRWPAGSPGGVGGEFAPADAATGDSAAGESSSAPVIPAQVTIPVPFDVPGGIPFPSEIVPPPAIPDIYPRELRNPYPDRAGCDEEWADAIKYCDSLRKQGLLKTDNYRGMGDYYQCVMGNVSERCGGYSTGA